MKKATKQKVFDLGFFIKVTNSFFPKGSCYQVSYDLSSKSLELYVWRNSNYLCICSAYFPTENFLISEDDLRKALFEDETIIEEITCEEFKAYHENKQKGIVL